MAKEVAVIGAGLCGTLLAIRLAQHGFRVILTERREDIRKSDNVAGRSINLALSDRGLRGLRLVDMEEEIQEQCIPMYGRRIHPLEEQPFTSLYSGRQGKYINSVSRTGLNMALLNKAETYDNIRILFNTACNGVDFSVPEAFFTENQTGRDFTLKPDVIIGTDGSNSAVRKSMLESSHKIRFSFSLEYLSHDYKELTIPPDSDGGFRIEKNALHIWPRGGFMLIALPNLDGSFTVTLFLAHSGPNSFAQLTTPEAVNNFFQEHFPDAVHHMPDLVNDFFSNPTSVLATIKCNPWSADGKVLIMGDAAHAIVPFYGQGMNASFEDVVVFDELLEKEKGDLESVIRKYEAIRRADTDAIADLAIDNFYEMRDHVADPVFQKKRKLEMMLEQTYSDYQSKYSLVTFNEQIPYANAMRQGRAQDEKLMEICAGVTDVEKLIIEKIYQDLKAIVY